jgi:nickel-dependent lactate racemase
MKALLKYKKDEILAEISQGKMLGEILPISLPVLKNPTEEIYRALQTPIGTPSLSKLASGKRKIAIVISDQTRPVKTKILLPPLIDTLQKAGISNTQISIIVALGIHRPLTETELIQLVGEEVYSVIPVFNHDPCDVVHLGFTSRGTPLEINRHFIEADLRICTGNIDLHFFAGYAGGAKAVMPGLSTRNAIANNHKMQLLPKAESGVLKDNPVREDIDEAGQIIGIDFILNLVQNEEKEIIAVCAGDVMKAHRHGCKIIDQMYKIPLSEKADVVIASAGGYPKDVNLYQAQKSLDNAAHAVKPGGTIFLIAACGEGYGESIMEEWLLEAKGNPDIVLKRLSKEFILGGHKAAAIARVAKNAKIVLFSEMSEQQAQNAFMQPVKSILEGLEMCEIQPDKTIWIMPYACYTLPEEEITS